MSTHDSMSVPAPRGPMPHGASTTSTTSTTLTHSSTRVSEEEIMTTLTNAPATGVLPADTVFAPGAVIDHDVRDRVVQVIAEMNHLIKGRAEVIWGAWVGRIAKQHVLMVGPGGTGKSFLARTMAGHITGAKYFEVALDETTDPSSLFGPPDIKAMVEDGRTRRVGDGMLPEATDAFLDEFFNANGPLLHSIMPALNERVWHDNGESKAMPLRQCLMGTNKLTADTDQQALWDRVHLRFAVDYINDRDDQLDMVKQSIARMAALGRGVGTSIASTKTTVSIDELDAATAQSLHLTVPDAVAGAFLDVLAEIRGNGIAVSDRRMNEGMFAVLANAWLRGHEEVQVADLDILQAMWWTTQDEAATAREIILNLTNPSEKAAIKLLDDLDKVTAELAEAVRTNMDPHRLRLLAVEKIRNAQALETEAKELLTTAQASGSSTTRVEEVINKAAEFIAAKAKEHFGLDASALTGIAR